LVAGFFAAERTADLAGDFAVDLAAAPFFVLAGLFAAGFSVDVPADFAVDAADLPADFAAGLLAGLPPDPEERLVAAGALLAAVRLATRDVMR
jgi:hypothetical protein